MKVFDHGIQVERLELFRVIELFTHGIGLWGMLVQDFQVHLIRPPINIRVGVASAVRYRHFASAVVLLSLVSGETLPDEVASVFPYVFILRILINTA